MKHFTCVDLGGGMGMFDQLFPEAIEVANKLDTNVTFDFNGKKICLSKHSTIEHVWEEYQRSVGVDERLSVYGEGY